MRKLLFLFLFLAASVAVSAQIVVIARIEPDSLKNALIGCEKSAARIREQNGKSWPVYLSADKKSIFYVREAPIMAGFFKYEFILLQDEKRTYAAQ